MAVDRQELQGLLTNLSQNIRVSDQDLSQSKGVMRDVTQTLLDGLQRQHGLVRNFEYTGSSYEGTKILQADEFDVMVLLDGNVDRGLDIDSPTPGYAALSPNNPASAMYSRFLDQGDEYICPTSVARAFTSMVQTQLNRLDLDFPVTVKRHGPAVMLKIRAPHQTIEVDLVPTFIVQGKLFVAKPYKSYAEIQERAIDGIPTSLLWRQSTSLQEKAKLRDIDRDHGCRRKCLKILKYIRTQDATLSRLTSFHFKSLVLHQSEVGDWRDERMADRFLGLLRALADYLANGVLEHYFVPEVNLLDGIRQITLGNMEGRVRGIINSAQAMRRILRFASSFGGSRTSVAEITPITPEMSNAEDSWCLIL